MDIPGIIAAAGGKDAIARRRDLSVDAVKKWDQEHRWSPNQLRHAFATEVRRIHGLEASQVLLGHSGADITQIYAERDERLGMELAKKIG